VSGLTSANSGLLVTSATGVPSILAGPGTTGNILQSNAAAAPSFSTATYPSTAGTAGKVLISDGTNIVSSTPTFPNASATSGKFIRSDGTNWIASTPTLPTSAGTSGKVLQSDGTNYIESTATYPATATGTGTILRANGTNWVATTATYPTTTTANQILYSSATNVVGEITTANNSILSTNGSGVPTLNTSLTNDYTFTSSTAGGTRTLTVSNTDNTNVASKAIVVASTGGASSGDALFQASTTTTTWSLGVDNSVTSPTADPFVISQGTALGTNNIMSVATSGEINYPLQPAFLATSTLQSDQTGDGTTYTVTFSTEIFDQNSDYSSPTFTAPVTGRYSLGTILGYSGLGAGNTSGFTFIITSNRNYAIGGNPANQRNSGGAYTEGFHTLADMDAADTASISANVSGGTKVVDLAAGSFFYGNLVA
jgi:hypothetical protein